MCRTASTGPVSRKGVAHNRQQQTNCQSCQSGTPSTNGRRCNSLRRRCQGLQSDRFRLQSSWHSKCQGGQNTYCNSKCPPNLQVSSHRSIETAECQRISDQPCDFIYYQHKQTTKLAIYRCRIWYIILCEFRAFDQQ